MRGPIPWLNLFLDDDPHPRRFDGPESLKTFLQRIERLSAEQIEALILEKELHPPQARRHYVLKPLEE